MERNIRKVLVDQLIPIVTGRFENFWEFLVSVMQQRRYIGLTVYTLYSLRPNPLLRIFHLYPFTGKYYRAIKSHNLELERCLYVIQNWALICMQRRKPKAEQPTTAEKLTGVKTFNTIHVKQELFRRKEKLFVIEKHGAPKEFNFTSI